MTIGARILFGSFFTAGDFEMTETPSSNAPQASIVDRRKARRQRSLLGTQIIFRNGNCVIGGQILNFSDDGALVRPADVFQCPDKFALKPRYDPPRDCEVMWRKGDRLGIRYVQGPNTSAAQA